VVILESETENRLEKVGYRNNCKYAVEEWSEKLEKERIAMIKYANVLLKASFHS